MGTKEQAVNENVIREKEMGNGERETIKIKLRSPVRVSLVSHLSLLYFCFLSKFYFALYLLYWSQKSFKKRIRCLSKKPDNSIQRTLPDGSVRLRTFAPVIRRFCSISTTDVRFQTVQSDLGRLRLFSCVSIQFRKLLRPFPVGSLPVVIVIWRGQRFVLWRFGIIFDLRGSTRIVDWEQMMGIQHGGMFGKIIFTKPEQTENSP